jgi:hypothetical protein
MYNLFSNGLVYISEFLTAITLVYAAFKVRFLPDQDTPKIILTYLVISLTSDLIGETVSTNRMLYVQQSIFTIFELFLFTWFYVCLFDFQGKLILFVPCIAIAMIYFLNFDFWHNYFNSSRIVAYECIYLILLSLTYFIRELPKQTDGFITKEFNYWATVSALIYFGGITPLYVYRSLFSNSVTVIYLHDINNVLFVSMLILFIKAYSCSKETIKVLR